MAEDRFLLKDLFNELAVEVIAGAIADAEPAFDANRFMGAVFDEGWADRELKARMRHIAVTLRLFLPDDYRGAVAILLRASPRTEAAGFAAMALSDYVEVYGLEDPAVSLPALGELTKVASAEFAVRPFIIRYPDETFEQMIGWAEDPDPRLRRLASEGCRPRLPWGMALKPLQEDPSPVLPILEMLRHDPSEDVRRSVANNLNDIAKDHPGLVVETLAGWQDGSPEVAGITRHALRTLLKRGNPDALRLLGFDPEPVVLVHGLSVIPAEVPVGEATQLEFTVVSEAEQEQALMVDAVVHFRRARNRTSPKVFKLRTVQLEPGAAVVVQRKLSLQPLSTRRIYPGTHAVEVQINGTLMGRVEFEVVDG
jgi:3-methyladenine DNA glycosylase AlkC